MAIDKRTYETPAVERIGSFEDITQGNTVGSRTDAAFPVGADPAGFPGFALTHLS